MNTHHSLSRRALLRSTAATVVAGSTLGLGLQTPARAAETPPSMVFNPGRSHSIQGIFSGVNALRHGFVLDGGSVSFKNRVAVDETDQVRIYLEVTFVPAAGSDTSALIHQAQRPAGWNLQDFAVSAFGDDPSTMNGGQTASTFRYWTRGAIANKQVVSLTSPNVGLPTFLATKPANQQWGQLQLRFGVGRLYNHESERLWYIIPTGGYDALRFKQELTTYAVDWPQAR